MNDDSEPSIRAERAYEHLPALVTIPDEIIEQIADNLRFDIDDDSYAECYLSDNCTDFASARFDLSSFSKVCTSVRWPAERALYRDIQVHFDGWDEIDNSAHYEWRGGSLRLLLRTLEGRIDLWRCVRSVQMDWPENDTDDLEQEDTAPFQDAFRQFFSRCTFVQRLNVMSFPFQIFSAIAPLPQVTTFATSVPSLHSFRTVITTFPVLQDLYLAMSYRIEPPPKHVKFHHQLKKLHLESICVPSVFWALEVCAHITEELRITSSEFSDGQSPALLNRTLSPSVGTNLRSLWLQGDQFNFLAHPDSSLAQAIRQLPSLQHLHVSRCLSFHAAAFSVLPSSLRCLYLSEYGEWADGNRSRHVFVAALSRCLAQALRGIEMVTIHGLTRKKLQTQILGDLTPLENVCGNRNIPFHITEGTSNNWTDGEIRVLFA